MIAELDPQASTAAQIQHLNLGLLHPSATNPRKHFDESALQELSNSIREHGVKLPLLVRPSKHEQGKYEIIAGERRFRASVLLVEKMAALCAVQGLPEEKEGEYQQIYQSRCELPVIVEQLDDATVLELQLIENLQRRDLTALEEANGYKRLLELPGDRAYTPAVIAKKIGRSVNTVLYKLKMLQAPTCLQEALEKGKVGERHLVLVAGVPGAKAREEVAKKVLKGDPFEDEEILSVRSTNELINEHYRKSLKGVPWSLEDAELDAEAGPCTLCPHFAKKAAEQDPDLAAELGNERGQTDPLTCMNPGCFKAKQQAVWKLKEALSKEGVVKILKPKEAEKIINERGNIHCNAQSKFVKLDDRPGFEILGHYNNTKLPTWRELVGDRLSAGAIHVANAKEGGIVEIVEVPAVVAAAKAHPKYGKTFETVKDSGKKVLSPDEKKQKEKESFEHKVSLRAKHVLLQLLFDKALSTGGVETSLAVLDAALHNAGMDGNKLISEWLGLELNKKGQRLVQGQYREAILDRLRQRDAGKPEVDAMIMLATVANWTKNYGLKCSVLDPLKKHFNFSDKDVIGLATVEVKKALEAKAVKKKDKGKRAETNSSDPTDWTVEKEVSKTEAADKIAKKEKVVAAEEKPKPRTVKARATKGAKVAKGSKQPK